MSDVQLLARYERVVVRIKKYLPQLKLHIEQEKFCLDVPHTTGSGTEQTLFVTTCVRELDVYVEALIRGADLVRCGVLPYEPPANIPSGLYPYEG